MRVCSIYEPGRVFVIDKSLLPVRIFHEKGSKRWWTALELQSRSEQPKKLSAKVKKEALTSRSVAFQSLPPGTLPQSTPIYSRTSYAGAKISTIGDHSRE
jgi:hypothetical protein